MIHTPVAADFFAVAGVSILIIDTEEQEFGNRAGLMLSILNLNTSLRRGKGKLWKRDQKN